MTPALLLTIALAAAAPASAQTPLVTLKASGDVGAPVLSAAGDRIAGTVGEDRVAVWSLPEGTLLREMTFPQRPLSLIFGQADQIIVALAGGAIEFRSVESGATVRRMDARVRQPVLALSADGRLLASAGAEQIRLWDATGTLLSTFGHDFGNVASLAFSPDSTQLVSAGLDTEVHFWNVATGKRRASLPDRLLPTFSVTFTADGRHMVIAGANGAIEIVDVAKASVARRFPAEKWAVVSAALSPDGRFVGAEYMNVDSMAQPAPLAVWDLASGRVVRRVTPTGRRASTSGFTSAGRLLYTTSNGRELTVWALPASNSRSSDAAAEK